MGRIEKRLLAHLVRLGEGSETPSHTGKASLAGIAGAPRRHLGIRDGEAVWRDGPPPDLLDEPTLDEQEASRKDQARAVFGAGAGRRMQ